MYIRSAENFADKYTATLHIFLNSHQIQTERLHNLKNTEKSRTL